MRGSGWVGGGGWIPALTKNLKFESNSILIGK